jgi:uncharacterized repeat protein (TIGR03803 family)
VIYSFTGGVDGGGPYLGNPIFDAAGNLYDTASMGGQFGAGVVLKLTPGSGSSWTETVLYSFAGSTDGANPTGGVIFDAPGNLYGVTQFAGLMSCNAGLGCGTVFQLVPSIGNWTNNILHTFAFSDGADPYAGLTFDSSGNLYGTTVSGGLAQSYGVVFKLSQASGIWTETLLYTFDQKHGETPYGGVIVSQTGIVYGTASFGGLGPLPGYGVVFSIAQ